MERIDPHEHTINRQKLFVHLAGKGLVENRRLGLDAECRKLFEDAVIAIVLGCCGSPCRAIAAPDNCDSMGFYSGHTTPTRG